VSHSNESHVQDGLYLLNVYSSIKILQEVE